VTTIEIEGFFWIPDQPDNKAAGRLTFDDAEAANLALIGSLDTSRDVSRIIGLASDGVYTLDDCFVLRSEISGITKQTYSVGRIFGGVAYDTGEEPMFDRVDLCVANLIEWVQPPEIVDDADFGRGPDGRGQRFAVTLDEWEGQQIALPHGALRLGQSRGLRGDGLRERTLAQDLWFSLRLDARQPLAEVLDIASDLQDLVSIGTDRVAAYEYVRLYDSEFYREGPNGQRIPEAIRLLVPWHAQPDSKSRPPSEYDMAFTFNDLGGMDGVARWLEVATRCRSMLGHVMTTRYVRMFADIKLSFRLAALNGLHMTWKGYEREVFVTLTQLAELAGAPFTALVPDVEAWCRQVKDERHNLAHHYGRPAHVNNSELYNSAEVANWLFVLCMLRLAQAPEAVFERIGKNPQLRWLQRKLASSP
jgi:hypothetical protein